ncbi:hypothetical protein B1B04_14700 [Lysinibacillus sp. KCTC 33748]|uniref:hypothetical protein n=1 Tax=unclassified Lysinibacillus TaxID=2636778 RepID=UPI0009A7651B|nr:MULTISPECIES: hypothetical protein [unclassified Lysinibacillus]OXS72864.1 hypothetical protein B1B04_14700 [Lysinibacillus sp. KCTC 33748]SKB89954.1 hypothetical protein SAMN06295926_111118 [Lysinibacillus sp. AC-3]
MEDSKSKLYSTQDIEELKQKIETYKDTLTSLKTGTSMEDYLFMKIDFDGIKTQMALLEGLTETIDDKQNSQIGGYEEQIKLLSAQIESLNQTIEEMNQELLRVLNKLLTIENTEAPTATPKTENTSKSIANGVQRDLIITQTTNQSAITSKQPSYKMLQSLAGKVINAQLDGNNGIPSAHNENQRNVPEERHFNQQYFQSINTHPSQIYNGLYRNTTTKSTFHFKHATNAQEIPISVYESNTLPHAEIHNSTGNDLNTENLVNYGEPEKINNTVTIDEMSSVITNEPVTSEVAEVINEHAILEASKVVNEHAIPEASEAVNEHAIPEASKVVNEHAILEASQVVNEHAIPEASQVVNEHPIPEASQVVNEHAIPEASQVVNEHAIPEASQVVNGHPIPEASQVVKQVDTNTSTTLKSNEFEVFEATPEEKYETHIQIEEINKQPELKEEATEEGHKKEKNSLFFNFFRKWS